MKKRKKRQETYCTEETRREATKQRLQGSVDMKGDCTEVETRTEKQTEEMRREEDLEQGIDQKKHDEETRN